MAAGSFPHFEMSRAVGSRDIQEIEDMGVVFFVGTLGWV